MPGASRSHHAAGSTSAAAATKPSGPEPATGSTPASSVGSARTAKATAVHSACSLRLGSNADRFAHAQIQCDACRPRSQIHWYEVVAGSGKGIETSELRLEVLILPRTAE